MRSCSTLNITKHTTSVNISNPNIRSQNHVWLECHEYQSTWFVRFRFRPWIVLEGWIPRRCFPHWLTGMPKFWFWKTVELMSSLMYLSPIKVMTPQVVLLKHIPKFRLAELFIFYFSPYWGMFSLLVIFHSDCRETSKSSSILISCQLQRVVEAGTWELLSPQQSNKDLC